MAEIAIGIDLGTSNSCVARAANGTVEVLANAYGEKTTASVVAFRADGSISVGNAVRANIIHEPEHTIYSAKRLIGRYFFSEEVKKARAIYSYPIIEGENHALRIQARGEDFSLPEISAMVLRELKGIAEARLGQPVTKAVVTVPAYFNDNQRQATVDAGRIAGLDVLRIINEPTAAALAYGFGKGLKQRVAIYDLGGGTFDISVLEIGEDIFEVLAVSGDTFLGGDDFDDRIIDLLADEFVAAHGINLRNDRYALEKLKAAAETAKCGLSVDDEVEIRIPEVIDGDEGTLSLERTLTRTEFGGLVGDLVQRTFKVCDEALQQAGIVARDLDGVVLVGGPTRLPLIRDAVRSYFQQDPKTDVDPDLVVGMGAAIQASSLISPSSDAFLLDVTPLSLRIGVAGGLAETVIERNTPVPIEQTRTFTTFKDHQESVSIRVYQGESREVEENERLGEFEFSGFEKARRGEVEIDVTFEIDTDGIVSVTARDRRTGEEASTRITLSSGLSESEIQSIIERGNTDRVLTEAGPDETTTAPRDEVQEALSALPLTDSSPGFAARLEPAPDAAPAPSALEPEPGLGSGAVPDIAAEGPLAVAAAPRPEPASAPDPSQTVLYSEPDDLDLDDDLNLDLEDNALALAPPEGIGDRGTDPMLADSAAGPMSTDPAAQTVVAEPIASALDAPPGSGSANSNAITVPDLDGDTGAADRDEGPTEEHEIFRAEIDIRDAAASIDLEPAVSNEIDLEIEIEVDGTVEGAAVHELTDDLSIDTTSNLTELTTGKAPAIADPAESAKDELFERTGIDLTADDDSKNEG